MIVYFFISLFRSRAPLFIHVGRGADDIPHHISHDRLPIYFLSPPFFLCYYQPLSTFFFPYVHPHHGVTPKYLGDSLGSLTVSVGTCSGIMTV